MNPYEVIARTMSERIFISKDGRLWKEVRRDPCTTKDGRDIKLSVWHTECKADYCTEMVEVRTPIEGDYTRYHCFDLVHCSAHRLPRTWLARFYKKGRNERWKRRQSK